MVVENDLRKEILTFDVAEKISMILMGVLLFLVQYLMSVNPRIIYKFSLTAIGLILLMIFYVSYTAKMKRIGKLLEERTQG